MMTTTTKVVVFSLFPFFTFFTFFYFFFFLFEGSHALVLTIYFHSPSIPVDEANCCHFVKGDGGGVKG